MLLKSKNRSNDSEESDNHKAPPKKLQTTYTAPALAPPNKAVNDFDWDVVDEYDPFWPNEYEKLIKERRERDADRNRERDRKRRNVQRNNYNDNDSPPHKFSGFAGRSDEAENFNKSPPQRSGGVTIAPPASLQESTPIIPVFQNPSGSAYGSGSVAAKIMAKYGFKDGQGLGKQEQGMSVALQVEKTSKRGGRIIHEKELQKELMQPPAAPSPPIQSSLPLLAQPKEEPSITEIMKAPSKVVLLRVIIKDFFFHASFKSF